MTVRLTISLDDSLAKSLDEFKGELQSSKFFQLMIMYLDPKEGNQIKHFKNWIEVRRRKK